MNLPHTGVTKMQCNAARLCTLLNATYTHTHTHKNKTNSQRVEELEGSSVWWITHTSVCFLACKLNFPYNDGRMAHILPHDSVALCNRDTAPLTAGIELVTRIARRCSKSNRGSLPCTVCVYTNTH